MSDLITASLPGSDGTKLRILVCHTCKAMVPIPDVPGRGDDELLMARVMEHQFPPTHHGNEVQSRPHEMILCRVPEKLWNSPAIRSQVVAEIQKYVGGAGAGEGMGAELYDVKNNFMEDAMDCWRKKHGRTSDCGDYMSDRMTILADSRSERRELGLDPKARATIKLCQFCPVHSVVMGKKRAAGGAYK